MGLHALLVVYFEDVLLAMLQMLQTILTMIIRIMLGQFLVKFFFMFLKMILLVSFLNH